jgi:hypothetical protein
MTLTKAHNRMIDGASINVKDYGATGDGVTSDTAAIQSAIDDCPEGGSVFFPSGTYYLKETALTGNANVLAVTGAAADQVDFICLKLNQKQNIIIYGDNATITHDRGYVFSLLLCENVEISNLVVRNTNDPWSYTPPADWEPSAVLCAYSAFCVFSSIMTDGEYRGIRLERTTGCSVENCSIHNNIYIGIVSYGPLYTPAGWSLSPLTSIFSVPTSIGDAGVLIQSNLVDTFKYFGILCNGEGIVLDNRIQNPQKNSVASPGGVGGISIGKGKVTAQSNYFYCDNSVNTEVRSNTGSYSNINIKFEDVASGAVTSRISILDNVMYGGSSGVVISEAVNVLVSGNHISNYTGSAINIQLSVALGSNVEDLSIINNCIGNVDPNTTRTTATYNNIGGIVTSSDGTTYTADNLVIKNNIFDREVGSIIDGTAQTNHRNDIYVNGLVNSLMTISPNYFSDSDGVVTAPLNLPSHAGRRLSGLPVVIDATATIPVFNGLEEITVLFLGASGNAIATIPTRMFAGQRLTIINATNYDLTIARPAAGYTIMGQVSALMTNSGGTAGKVRSSITFVAVTDSYSSDAYNLEPVQMTEQYGASITYP